MKKLYGMGTQHNKTLILHGESSMMGRTVTVILVKEKLGSRQIPYSDIINALKK